MFKKVLLAALLGALPLFFFSNCMAQSSDLEDSLMKTALYNNFMDGYQTMQIHDLGFRETNPLIRPYIDNKPLIGGYFVARGYLLWRGVESIEDKNLRLLAYAAWAIYDFNNVHENQKLMGTGFPVISFSFRF